MPTWKLVDGGGNQPFAMYHALVNLNETGLLPPVPVASSGWRVALLTAEKRNAWTTAIVEFKWQASKSGPRYSMIPAESITASKSPPCSNQTDVTAIPYLTAEITTAEGSDAWVDLWMCLAKYGG